MTTILTIGATVLVILALIVAINELAHRWRRHRRRRGLTDREVAHTQAPYADISVWPARAPRNGSAYEDAEQ